MLELHGSVHRNHCTRCGAFYTLDDVLRSEGCLLYTSVDRSTQSFEARMKGMYEMSRQSGLAVLLGADSLSAVSYTHLDVYKRQS